MYNSSFKKQRLLGGRIIVGGGGAKVPKIVEQVWKEPPKCLG